MLLGRFHHSLESISYESGILGEVVPIAVFGKSSRIESSGSAVTNDPTNTTDELNPLFAASSGELDYDGHPILTQTACYRLCLRFGGGWPSLDGLGTAVR